MLNSDFLGCGGGRDVGWSDWPLYAHERGMLMYDWSGKVAGRCIGFPLYSISGCELLATPCEFCSACLCVLCVLAS